MLKKRWQVVEYDNKTFITWYPAYTLLGAIVMYLFYKTEYHKKIEKACRKTHH